MKIYGPEIAEGSEITNVAVATGTAFPSNEDAGELFFRSDQNKMFIYSGTEWIDIQAIGSTIKFYRYTATASQTVFTGEDDTANVLTYDPDNVGVFHNGMLLDNNDYTASDGSIVTLGSGATVDDLITILNFEATYSDDYVKVAGDTLTGGFQQDKGTLTDQATVAVDFAVSNTFNWALGGNRTLSNPSNVTTNGGMVYIDVTADVSGPYTLTLDTYYNLVSGDLDWNASEVKRIWLVIRTTIAFDVYIEDIA